MTRINVGIDPKRLTDCHLRAEFREIQRLPSYYRKAVASGSINRIPSEFTLGTGHVLFFLDKWDWVDNRFEELFWELEDRGSLRMAENGTSRYYDGKPREMEDLERGHYGHYTPTPRDTELLVQRITERIEGSPKKYWHYRGARITPEQAIELLTKTE